MGIEALLPAPRSPWQNAYVERMIGSIRRDCLDHIVVLNERQLKRILASYFVNQQVLALNAGNAPMDTPVLR